VADILHLVILLTCACPAAIQAQSEIDFSTQLSGASVVPQNPTIETATGSFSLIGNTLNYALGGDTGNNFFPSTAFLGGPATVGANGGVIYDLGGLLESSPFNGQPGTFSYSGSLTLGTQQAADLRNGLWYVDVVGATIESITPEIRGQLTLVPEPSTYGLLFLGMSGIFILRLRKAA
jgi:hypothetical protein